MMSVTFTVNSDGRHTEVATLCWENMAANDSYQRIEAFHMNVDWPGSTNDFSALAMTTER